MKLNNKLRENWKCNDKNKILKGCLQNKSGKMRECTASDYSTINIEYIYTCVCIGFWNFIVIYL